MSNDVQDANQIFASEPPEGEAQPDRSTDLDRDSIDLALRFLVGFLSLSGDEAARRLLEEQRRLDRDPRLWESETPAGTKPLRRKAWHLGIGLMRRGQKRARRSLRSGYDISRRAAGQVSSMANRWGVSTVTSPVRKPAAALLERWRAEADRIIREGEVEELQGKVLATGTLGTLTKEVMDEIAENPDMHELVQDLIGQQGVGMATSIMDNARSVTLTADEGGEALVRWLLRRAPRRELPPSPVQGQRQTMYEPTARVEQEVADAG